MVGCRTQRYNRPDWLQVGIYLRKVTSIWRSTRYFQHKMNTTPVYGSITSIRGVLAVLHHCKDTGCYWLPLRSASPCLLGKIHRK